MIVSFIEKEQTNNKKNTKKKITGREREREREKGGTRMRSDHYQ